MASGPEKYKPRYCRSPFINNKAADRVIFLNNGVIEGTGSHEELMRLEAYASLAKAYEKAGVDS